MIVVGEHIKRARKEMKLSQKQLSELLHVTAQTVSNWESERNEPSSEAITTIANLSGHPVAWFFKDSPSEASSQHTSELTELYDRLNSKGKTLLLNYAHDLSELSKYTEK